MGVIMGIIMGVITGVIMGVIMGIIMGVITGVVPYLCMLLQTSTLTKVSTRNGIRNISWNIMFSIWMCVISCIHVPLNLLVTVFFYLLPTLHMYRTVCTVMPNINYEKFRVFSFNEIRCLTDWMSCSRVQLPIKYTTPITLPSQTTKIRNNKKSLNKCKHNEQVYKEWRRTPAGKWATHGHRTDPAWLRDYPCCWWLLDSALCETSAISVSSRAYRATENYVN